MSTKNQEKNKELFYEKFKNSKHFNSLKLLDEYINSRTEIKCKCLICGHEFSRIGRYYSDGRGCPECKKVLNRTQNKYDVNMMIKKINEKYNDEFIYISGYKSMSNQCLFFHNKCGNYLQITPHSLLHREIKICCGNRISSYEKILSEFLKEHNIRFCREYKFEELKFNGNMLRFDFYLLDYNILIEIDGELHGNSGYTKKYNEYNDVIQRDKMKNDFCDKNNIVLIRDTGIHIYKIIEKITNEITKK